MTQRTPVFYDSSLEVHRPMDSGDTVPPSTLPVSVVAGNQLQILGDGLYVGTESGFTLYIDAVNGVDTNAGTKALPIKTLAQAFTTILALFPGGIYMGSNITIALRCGQTHVQTSDFSIPRGSDLSLAFYGDINYGDFNSGMVNGTTNPWIMSDLSRPTISPGLSTIQSLNKIFGFNLQGGTLNMMGVTVQLPAAAPNNLMTDVSFQADYVRSSAGSQGSLLSLSGVVCNITDTSAYWGLVGCQARTSLNLTEFATQFQILGQVVTSTSVVSTAVLNARANFIKFYSDFPGNNQTVVSLAATSATASNGSGLIYLSWSDTEALVVTGTKVSLQTSPPAFLSGYGVIEYVTGLTQNSVNQPLNLISSRLI